MPDRGAYGPLDLARSDTPTGGFNVQAFGAKGDAIDGNDSYIDTPAGQFLVQDETVTLRDGNGAHTPKVLGVNKGVAVPGVDAQWVVNNAMTTAQTAAALKAAIDSLAGPNYDGVAVLDVNRTGGVVGATDRVWIRSPNYTDAVQSDTVANGAFVITDMRKGSLWSGTDDTAAFNAAWAALVANGGGTIYIPSRVNGRKARYRIAGGVGFNLSAGGAARDVTALIEGDWSLIILDGGGIQATTPGSFDIGGELARCEFRNVTFRGRSYWSEDGVFGAHFSGYGAAALFRFGPVRWIGWNDGPGNGAIWAGLNQVAPGSALYVEGACHVIENEFFGTGARRHPFSAHNIVHVILEDCFAYDSGILEGINFEHVGANSFGWFGFGNAVNGTNGFDWGIIEVRNLTHDENYCFAPGGAVRGAINFDPSLIAPGQAAAFDANARYGSILCEQIHGKMSINSGGFGAGVVIRKGDANTLIGLYDFRPAGLSQHVLAIDDCVDTVLRGGKGTVGATGDDVHFIGATNVYYREEACSHKGWTLAAGATLPAIAEVERNGVEARLVLTDGTATVTANMLASPSAITDGQFAQVLTAGVFLSGLPAIVPTIAGLFLDAAPAAVTVVRLVEKSGQRVTVVKDGRPITRGETLGASPGVVAAGATAGQVRQCLHGACLRALVSSAAAAGTSILAEWIGVPRDKQHWLYNATGGAVAPGYVGKLQAGAAALADLLVVTAAANDLNPHVVVAVSVAADDICETAQADDIVPVAFDAAAAAIGAIAASSAAVGQAAVPLVAALLFNNIIGIVRDQYLGGAPGTLIRIEIGGAS